MGPIIGNNSGIQNQNWTRLRENAEKDAKSKADFKREIANFDDTFKSVSDLDGAKGVDTSGVQGEVRALIKSEETVESKMLRKTSEGFGLEVAMKGAGSAAAALSLPGHEIPKPDDNKGYFQGVKYQLNQGNGTISALRVNSEYSDSGVETTYTRFTLDTKNERHLGEHNWTSREDPTGPPPVVDDFQPARPKGILNV